MRRFSISLLLTLTATVASATMFVVPSDREMVRRSDAIVIGSAMGSFPQLTAEGGVETVTPFSVRETIKGDLPATINIYEPGGVFGDRAEVIPGVPRFETGSAALLFLKKTGDDRWSVAELAVGKFDYASDSLGRRLLVRSNDVNGWDPDLKPHREVPRSADDFVRFIRREVAGTAQSSDYFIKAAPQSAPLVIAPAAAFSATSYTMTINGSLGSRWSVFPSAVTFYANSAGEPGAPGNGVTAVQAAIAAWDNDPNSNVNYVYGGTDSTHTSGLHGADGVNTVLWERDLSTWGAAPFTCSSNGYSGTLGLGGITNASGTNTVNGESFMTTQEGDVEMNKGLANCTLLFSNGDFNTAVTHEIGHTLGFRHSDQTRDSNSTCSADATLECSTQAVMKSFISQGINAALQPWDQHAVDAVYPGTSTTGGGGAPTTTIRGDFNGDGHTDIVWRNTSTGENRVWFMNGSTLVGTATLAAVTDQNWRIAGAGDINVDGHQDLVWHNEATGETSIWYYNGTSFIASGDMPSAAPQWSVVAVADFNGDGHPDLLWRNKNDGQVVIWFMNRRNFVSAASVASASLAFNIVGAADFSGDGVPDIVWQNPTTGLVVIWQMSSSGAFVSAVNLGVTSTEYRAMAVGDYNGDGSPDIVFRSTVTGGDTIWFFHGFTFAGAADIPTEPNLAWTIAAPR